MAIIPVQQIMQEHPEHARLPHDEIYNHGSAFCNGDYVSLEQASVPLIDAGFVHADAAYDVVTVSRGSFFRLDDHLARMELSCEKFFLNNPFPREEVREILHKLVALTGLKDAYVWWCVTRGSLVGAERSNVNSFNNGMYAFVTPYATISDDEQRTRGFDLMVSKAYNRIHPKAVDPTAKNFHWMDMKLALFEAKMAGKDWSVLTDANGILTEAPGANIWFVKNGELYTPAEGCLKGVTRQSVVDIAEEMGVPVHLGTYSADELRAADEAFTSTSAAGISPIRSVDDVVLGGHNGPGPLTEKIHNVYWEKRWAGWHGEPVNYALAEV